MEPTDNRNHIGKIMQIRSIAEGTFEVKLKLDEILNFKPGQYIWIELMNSAIDDPRGNRRAFSISSAPSDKDDLSIIFRSTPSQYKKTFLSLENGSEVKVIGPFGFAFTLPSDPSKKLFLIAGGTGITPFLSLLRHLKTESDIRPVTMIYNEDVEERIILKDELLSLNDLTQNKKVVIQSSKLLESYIRNLQDKENCVFYICGSQGFIDLAHQLLSTEGVFENQMHFEGNYPTSTHVFTLSSFFEQGKIKLSPEENEFSRKRGLLLSQLIESSTNHIVITDENGNIIFANEAAQRITGFTLEEMQGNTPRLWGGLMSHEFYEYLWETKKSGKSFTTEVVNRRKNGELYNASAHISALRDDKGSIVGFLATEEDISEIRNAEKQARQNLKELDNFFSASIEFMAIANTDGYFEKINPSFSNILGFDEQELLTEPFLNFVHKDDHESTQSEIAKLKAGQVTVNFTNRYRKKDGGYILLEWNAKPDGNKIYASARDITLKKEYADKIISLNRRLDLATSSAHIGVWEWDIKKDSLIWDEMMYKLYGITAKDFSGAYEAWKNGLHPGDRERSDKEIKMALEGTKTFDTQFRVIWPDNSEHTIRAYGQVIKDLQNNPERMIGVNWDITKEAEIDRQKTEFVSLASHQLKTPVGAINWDIEMLLNGDYGTINEKQKQVISEVFTLNKRMADLVSSLLNISRLDLGVFVIEPEPVDFASLCDEVILEMEPRRQAKQHTLTKLYASNLQSVSADPRLLRIIFQNFISNAIKYTQEKGVIKVKLEIKNEEIVFTVENNGSPIPIDDQNKIFGKMYRASNAQEQDPDGNGLGLYIVKKIVDSAGGKIWFSSKQGEDTLFGVSFPLSGMIARAGTKKLD